MIKQAALLALLSAAWSWAAPTIVELRPRGAELGRPFKLTLIGRDIPQGARIWSTMPASFTPILPNEPGMMMMAPGRVAQFLVEPKPDVAPGVYRIRIESQDGISNILFFTVGTFPELTEQESEPYSEPNKNDTIEGSEPVQTVPVVVNGTLRGAERDLYRVHGKAGESRIFEVESRRCGSAIDPVLRILDGAGNQLARSDDAAGAALDPRIEFKFPREGYYYVEVHDARFSRQVQNFYRLKIGSYLYADTIFPLGGQRGASTAVIFDGGNLPATAKVDVDLKQAGSETKFIAVAPPGSPAAPFLFAVSDYPELIEPSAPVALPAVINGRLARDGEVDRYRIAVSPGDKLLFEVQARELGTSKIESIVTAYDASGKKLDSAGDKPLPEDVFAVQVNSRTSNDPFLNLTVPEGVQEITLAIEDLARRGGDRFAYRIVARKQDQDFQLSLATPQVNVPQGGTAIAVVTADRRGYDGPIHLTIEDLPPGIRVEAGMIPRESVDPNNARSLNRRGVLVLSAEPDAEMPPRELIVWGVGKLSDGTELRRKAAGPATAIDVAGATSQGVVDRQRPLTAPWLGLHLPAASTSPQEATLEVKQTGFKRMAEGDRFEFAYSWKTRARGLKLPETLAVDVVGARDIRVTAFEENETKDGGTFLINTSKATDPAQYDVIIRGRVMNGSSAIDVYARPLALVVTERKEERVQTASAQ
jgi:hypothetical protein